MITVNYYEIAIKGSQAERITKKMEVSTVDDLEALRDDLKHYHRADAIWMSYQVKHDTNERYNKT